MRMRKGIVALVGAGLLTAGIGGVSQAQIFDDNDVDASANIDADDSIVSRVRQRTSGQRWRLRF